MKPPPRLHAAPSLRWRLHAYPPRPPPVTPPPDAAQEALLGHYLRAWEGHDLDGFVALLKEEATAIMPPWREWYAGRLAIRTFFEAAWRSCGGLRLVPTGANGQPAFAVYERAASDGHHRAFLASRSFERATSSWLRG